MRKPRSGERKASLAHRCRWPHDTRGHFPLRLLVGRGADGPKTLPVASKPDGFAILMTSMSRRVRRA